MERSDHHGCQDSPTTTAALWQHHILAALPPRDSAEYVFSKLMQDVATGIHDLTAASKKQTNVSTFATLFQSAAQKLRERESSAVTRLGHNVIAHNAVRSKRSTVNEANKTVNVVNTRAVESESEGFSTSGFGVAENFNDSDSGQTFC